MATDPSVKICLNAAVDRMLEALELAAPTPLEPQPWTITANGFIHFTDATSSTRLQRESPCFFQAARSQNTRAVTITGGMP